jgi:hypothetical protein
VSAGAATEGMDALGRHAYWTTLEWAVTRLCPDWSVGYVYDRWWPRLFATVSDDTDPWRDGEVRTREVNAGAVFVARRVRRTSTVLAAVNASSDALECSQCANPVDTVIRRRAIRVGWSFDNSRSYGYSISRESGTVMRVTWETAPEALGSDAGAGAMTFDARAYHHAGPQHAALAFRAAGASAWGDLRARRVFSAAGAGPETGDFEFGTGAVGLLRGLDTDAVVGHHALVGNIDYRFPLRSVQRGIGTVPVFFRTIHAAVFADAGQAWNDTFRGSDVRFSLGAEFSLDAVVGYTLPITFATGVAWRDDPVGGRRGVAMFGRIGRAF